MQASQNFMDPTERVQNTRSAERRKKIDELRHLDGTMQSLPDVSLDKAGLLAVFNMEENELRIEQEREIQRLRQMLDAERKAKEQSDVQKNAYKISYGLLVSRQDKLRREQDDKDLEIQRLRQERNDYLRELERLIHRCRTK